MPRIIARTALACAIGLGFAAGASAQIPVKPQPQAPNMPAPHSTVPEKLDGKPGDTTGSTGTLSDRLEKSDGVIAPPATGGGRTITPRDPGTTPVIPPPGSPGSSHPDADPK